MPFSYRSRRSQEENKGLKRAGERVGMETLEGRLMLSTAVMMPGVAADDIAVVDDSLGGIENARPLTIGSGTAGSHDFNADDDWFSFAASAGTTYHFTIDTPGQEVFFQLHDAEGTLLATPRISADGYLWLEWTAEHDEVLYLKTNGWDGFSRYTINSVIEHTQDPTSGAVAVPLQPGSVRPGLIESGGETQYFSFFAPKGATHVLHLLQETSENVLVALIAPDGKTIINGDMRQVPWAAPESGTYYLWVRSLNSRDTGTFSIGIDQQLDDHGNSPAEATPLAVGKVATGALQYLSDNDFFRMNVAGGGKYVLSLSDRSAAPGEWYWYKRRGWQYRSVSILDGKGHVLAESSVYKGLVAKLEWKAKASGVVYVRVQGNYGRVDYDLKAARTNLEQECAPPKGERKPVGKARHHIKKKYADDVIAF